VRLDLVHSGTNSTLRQKPFQLLRGEVGHPYAFDQPLPHAVLQASPRVNQFRGDLVARVSRDRPVDEKQVQVGHVEGLHGLEHCWPDPVVAVVVVPQFGYHEELVSFHHLVAHAFQNSRADLVLIFVVRGAVDVPVPGHEGRLHGLLHA